MEKDINKIEKVLLDRELKNISAQLSKIGIEIREVFSKYGVIRGQHSQELNKYLVENILAVAEPYYAGRTTKPEAITCPQRIPECIKELVLKWAVDDFFSNFDEITNIVREL